MIHTQNTFKIKADGTSYMIDLTGNKITEGTNTVGDLMIWLKRAANIKPREKYEWSFGMAAVDGGLVDVSNGDYLNEAPATGYQGEYRLDMNPANPRWRGWDEQRTFFFKSQDGKHYGHIRIRINPDHRDGASLEVDSFMNPAGSRNLEFDPAKQIR